jgi:hypothetical protein
MTPLHLLATGLAIATLAVFAAPNAGAQQRAGTSGLRLPPPAPPPSIGGFNGGFPVFVVEREVPVVVEVPVPAATAPPPLAPASGPPPRSGEDKRKPYVIGASYASLPGGCMKLIEEGVSFYYCSGDWYRQVGEGRSASYKAVQRKL